MHPHSEYLYGEEYIFGDRSSGKGKKKLILQKIEFREKSE